MESTDAKHLGILERLRGRMDQYVSDRVPEHVLAWVDQLIQEQDEFGFDPFGFQPDFLKYVLPLGHWLLTKYFRAESFGIENLPPGRVLVIANHSGQIPVDGMVIVSAGLLHGTPPRMMRSMLEKWVPTLPFLSYVFARTGQVVGTPENCRRLLERDEAILVFPEGVGGISKTWDKRYQLQRFGLGFMRLALETNTPILPVAVIGGEEQAPAFYNAKKVAGFMGAPAFPITPTFPWLGPLGLLPYPVRYRLHFGEPMSFTGDFDDYDRVIQQKVDVVTNALQALIDSGLEQRDTVFF